MDSDLYNIEVLFRSALESNEEMPSVKVWKAVDRRLDLEPVVMPKQRYITVRKASLLILCLLPALGLYETSVTHSGKYVTKQEQRQIVKHKKKSFTGNVNRHVPFKTNRRILHAETINHLPFEFTVGSNLLSLKSSSDSKFTPVIKATTFEKPPKKLSGLGRFSISGFYSPDLASYHLEDADVAGQPDNSEEIRRTERHEFSSTIGLLLEYRLNNKWTLQSGLTFSHTNIATEPKTIYAQPVSSGDIKYRLNVSSGYGYLAPSFQRTPAPGDTLRITAITHKLRYLGVPIGVKHSIIRGRITIETVTGLTVNFLTAGKLETEINKGPDNEIDVLNKIEGLKPVYLSGQAGIAAEYKLTDNVSAVLAPTARFALMSINKTSVVKSYPYTLGLSSGLKITF